MTPFKEFLQVGAGLVLPPPALPVINLDGTGLKIEWMIERTRTGTPDRGQITVYNLGMGARKAIHEMWKKLGGTYRGYVIDFSIGWGGLLERIIRGDVWKVTPEQRTDVDVVTVFEVGDGNKQVRDSVTLGQNFANVHITALIKIFVSQPPPTGMGIPIDPASLAKIVERASQLPVRTFNNYCAQAQNSADVIDDLIETLGLEWKVFQGSFIVTDKGNAATASPIAPVLSAQTGLLEWNQEDDGGIQIKALANPNVQPGSQVIVIDSFGVAVGAPAHRVEKVVFSGTTDGESIMEIMGRKAVLL